MLRWREPRWKVLSADSVFGRVCLCGQRFFWGTPSGVSAAMSKELYYLVLCPISPEDWTHCLRQWNSDCRNLWPAFALWPIKITWLHWRKPWGKKQGRLGVPSSQRVWGFLSYVVHDFPWRGFKWHENFGHVTCLLDDLSCSTNLITSTWQVRCRERSALHSEKQNAFIHCVFSDVFVLFSGLGRQITERERKRLLLFLWSRGGGGCEGVGLSAPCWEHGGGELGGWVHLDYTGRSSLKK